MTSLSSKNCVQDGYRSDWHLKWETCRCLSRDSASVWWGLWSISPANRHWGWEIRTLLWAGTKTLEWCHTSSPNPKKVQVQRSAGKVMLTFFCDYKRTILEHYMPRGSTVASATYSILLRENVKPAIRQKRRGLLTMTVITPRKCEAKCYSNSVNYWGAAIWVHTTPSVLTGLRAVGFSRLRSIEGYSEWNALPGRRRRGSVGGA